MTVVIDMVVEIDTVIDPAVINIDIDKNINVVSIYKLTHCLSM